MDQRVHHPSIVIELPVGELTQMYFFFSAGDVTEYKEVLVSRQNSIHVIGTRRKQCCLFTSNICKLL